MELWLQIESAPLLSIIVFSPLLGVLAQLFVCSRHTRAAWVLSLCFSGLTFALCLVAAWLFPRSEAAVSRLVSEYPGFYFVESLSWVPSLGIKYLIGIDGISLWLLLLSSLLSFLVCIASVSVKRHLRAYLSSMFLLETGMLGVFSALDGFTFYVFWELILIPMYFLIGVWGGERRIYAALKFFLFTALGSLLMLVAIVYLGLETERQLGAFSFDFISWAKLSFSYKEELLLFSAFALAFAIKIPLFPLHTWLPDAHVEAPTGGSVILAGVLLKLGLYGLIRIGVPVFPAATLAFSPWFAVLGIVGIIYGALVAWVQTDVKKLVAYSSVSHLGFCVLGYASLNLQGLQGSVLQMINHGISTAALFFLVGVLYERTHSRDIAAYGGLAKSAPCFSAVFMIFTLSSIGLPLTNGFVGEFLILLGSFKSEPFYAAFAVSGVVLGAVYMLSLYRRMVFGPLNPGLQGGMTDLLFREKVVFAPLIILVFVIGLYPKIVLDDTFPAVERVVLAADEASKGFSSVSPAGE